MKITEIRKKSDGDLVKLLEDWKEEAVALRFKIQSREVKNNQQLRRLKKDIARIFTIFKERHVK